MLLLHKGYLISKRVISILSKVTPYRLVEYSLGRATGEQAHLNNGFLAAQSKQIAVHLTAIVGARPQTRICLCIALVKTLMAICPER
eukprot:1160608-Pelagomonas_calceolata.AAC.15